METDKTKTEDLPTEPKEETAVPTPDVDAPLKGASAISDPEVPESDIDAPLKIETDPLANAGPNQEKSNKELFIVGTIIGVLIIAASVWFYTYLAKTNKDNQSKNVEVQETLASPSPTNTFNRSEFYLEVLNGSGTAGAAKKAADDLSSLGYIILSTGNANTNDYEGIQVEVSEEMQEEANALIADLTKNFRGANLSGVLKDSTASARIIIGK